MKMAGALLCLISLQAFGAANVRVGGLTESQTNVAWILGVSTSSNAMRLSLDALKSNIFFVNTNVTKPSGTANALDGGAGNIGAADDVYYTFTFVTGFGETPYGGLAQWVSDFTGHAVNLTAIPVSADSSVTARRIYRSLPGSPNTYYFLKELSNNTATTYSDNATDVALVAGRRAPYTDTASFPTMKLGTNYVFVVGGVSQNLVDGNYNPGLHVGVDAGRNSYGASESTFIGSRAGFAGTNAGATTLVGVRSMYGNKYPFNVTAVGQDSGKSYTNGQNLCIFGVDAFHFGDGDGNCGFGEGVGYNLSGKDNAIFGNWFNLTTTYTGNSNTFLGAYARPASATVSGAVALGAGASATNNQFMLGSTTTPITVAVLGNGDVFVRSNLYVAGSVNSASNFTGGVLRGARVESTGDLTIANNATVDGDISTALGTIYGNAAGITNGGSYTLPFSTSVSASPTANTTNYFGSDSSMNTDPLLVRMQVPRSGRIKSVFVRTRIAGTLGTSELVTNTLEISSAAATNHVALSNVAWNATTISWSNDVLNAAVTKGNMLGLRVTSPGWVTAPTTVRIYGCIYIE